MPSGSAWALVVKQTATLMAPPAGSNPSAGVRLSQEPGVDPFQASGWLDRLVIGYVWHEAENGPPGAPLETHFAPLVMTSVSGKSKASRTCSVVPGSGVEALNPSPRRAKAVHSSA